MILSWQENLMDGEIPPSWMWHLDHELEAWFEEVERKRKEKFGGRGDESTDMMSNELTKGRR